MMFTGSIAAVLVLLLGERLKSYSIILIPPILLIVGGGLGYALLPLVANVTTVIGAFVEQLLTLQPIIMGILIAVLFSILITTPITTVGIALAVSLAGIGSGAGNLGVVAAGFGLAVATTPKFPAPEPIPAKETAKAIPTVVIGVVIKIENNTAIKIPIIIGCNVKSCSTKAPITVVTLATNGKSAYPNPPPTIKRIGGIKIML